MSTTVGEYKTANVEEKPARAEEKASANGGGRRGAHASTTRMLSLDVFRGMTVAGMILVNNPGTWGAIYSPLEHATWNGWTPTDLIFPFFLFIVGVAITLALSRRVESDGSRRDLYLKIVRRSLIIFALGTFLAWFPFYNFTTHTFIGFSTVRLTGVLDRIAICYLFAALIFINTSWRRQAVIVAVLLLAYWAILMLVPAPGFAAGDLTKQGSIASYVDRTLLGNHIWKGGDKIYAPEGLLSTTGALATTLCGVLTGHFLRSRREPLEKVSAMFAAGTGCIIVGWAWNYWFPINKSLWTSSYVVFAAGVARGLPPPSFWPLAIQSHKRRAGPLALFPPKTLSGFFLTGICAKLLTLIKLTGADGKPVALQTVILKNLFLSWASPVNASLAFALCFVLIWLGLMAILYRRGIIIKV